MPTNKQFSKSKKTSIIALGLVAILAGVAVAYFLTRERFDDNRALGGTLTVQATMPDFSGQELYPTTTAANHPVDEDADATGTQNSAVATDELDITNGNTVKVGYQISATCEECLEDPAEIAACEATGNDPESTECKTVQARRDKIDQFNNLYIRIYKPGGLSPLDPVITPESPGGDKCTYNGCEQFYGATDKEYYSGRLADLSPEAPAKLDTIDAGSNETYSVDLWLANDPSRAQPQGVESVWEFFVDAKTPL